MEEYFKLTDSDLSDLDIMSSVLLRSPALIFNVVAIVKSSLKKQRWFPVRCHPKGGIEQGTAPLSTALPFTTRRVVKVMQLL
jgi:hypothetical protein